MSNKLMNWVWRNSPYRDATRLIHIAFADMARDSGEFWPMQSTIADKCKVNVRTVKRAVRQMQRDGYIESNRRGPTSNMYRLLRPEEGTLMSHQEGTPVSLQEGTSETKEGTLAKGRGDTHVPQNHKNPTTHNSNGTAVALEDYLEYAKADPKIKNPEGWANRAHQEQWDLEAKTVSRPTELIPDGTDQAAIDAYYGNESPGGVKI